MSHSGGDVAAGTSAGQESQRQRRLAEAHAEASAAAIRAAERFEVAERTERSVARALAPLAALGYHLLPDRRWPGSTRANVDLVVVGPAGVFVIDVKCWSEPCVADGRMFRGQEDVTDDVARLADIAYGAEAALAEIGLAPGEVHAVVVLAARGGLSAKCVASVDILGERDIAAHIVARGNRLTARQVDAVLARTIEHFPVTGAPAPIETAVVEPMLGAAEDALFGEQVLQDTLLASILAAPIEEWMSFLHPEQAGLVRRTFSGPSRIRGAAGTGKTVIALHRAAYLARSKPGTVLFATYIKTLPAVLATLLRRMAPEVADRVEFVSVHGFAARVLRERGIRCDIDLDGAEEAFAAAWNTVGRPGVLGSIDAKPGYWEDELRFVIKGRGLTRFDQYADLARVGRRRRLGIEHRRAVWELFVAYQEGLRSRGVCDFQDQVALADASLESLPIDGYSAVIIDEAQDLSASAMSMFARLAPVGQDGLTLIGDGQQTIYPGGFSLSELGISLAGRGVVMTTNYRNTAEILRFASSMVAGDEFADIDGSTDRAAELTASRSGQHPVIRTFARHGTAHDDALVQRIESVRPETGTGYGGIAVLGLANWQVKSAAAALTRAGVPWMALADYDGTPTEKVKVGTVKRAKGLEFAQVLLPRVKLSLLDPDAAPIDDAQAERRQLERRELFVAMTRARDGLWVGTIA